MSTNVTVYSVRNLNYRTTKFNFLIRKDFTMKKLCKIAVLLSTLLLIVCSVAFTVSADGEAALSITPTATTADGIRNNAHIKAGSLSTSGLSSASFYDADCAYTPYTVTRADGSDYVELVSNSTINTEKHFQFTPFAKEMLTYDSTKNQYGVFDFDIATESDLCDLAFVSNIRKGQSTSSNTYVSNAVNQYFNAMFTADRDKFMHVTVVQDLTNKMQYLFINNKFVNKVLMIDDASYTAWQNGEVMLLPSFKLQMHYTYTSILPPFEQNQSIFVDNLQYNYFAYNTSGDTLAGLLTSGLDSWSGRVFNESYDLPEIPDAIEIDGVRYKNVYDASAKLTEKEDRFKEVTFLRTTKVPLTVGCLARVYVNGNTFNLAPGFDKIQVSDGVYEVDNSTRNVTVMMNGAELFTRTVPRGAPLSALFGEENLSKSVVFGNGKLYKNVTWSGVDWNAGVADDMTISGSGLQVTGYIAHNGTSVVSTASLGAAISNSSVKYIILGSDVNLTSASIAINGTKRVYLNDHKITQEDGSNHCFNSNNTTDAAFFGPGTINNLVTTTSYGLLFTSQTYTSSVVEFNDLTINVAQHVAVTRGGTLRLNNCECNVFSAFNSTAFNIGERATAPITVDIIGTYVNFTHYATSVLPVFKQVASSTDIAHTVNITNSTIISQTSLFDISAANNLQVNVSDSTLVAQYLVSDANASSSTHGKINFINSVNVNNGLLNISKANTSGLKLVKSNNHLAPVCYSNSYATYTWWCDNSTELWAAGSTPVRNDLFIPTEKVEAGKTYTSGMTYEKAPFSLKGNLTLGSDIAFNLYTTNGKVDYVTVGGRKILGVKKSIDGVVYDTFTVKLSPAEATSPFDVFFTLNDGNTVGRTISVVDYAKAVLANDPSSALEQIILATLNYIASSATYFGINADLSEISEILSVHTMETHVIPTSVTNANNGNVSNYFTGVQLDLSDTLKMRFNVKSGANITSLSIQVNGRDREYERFTSYVEIDLRAYELSDVITITVNGIVRDYSLAEYLIGANTLASGSTSYGRQCAELFKSTKGNLANALYNYSIAARTYSPIL